MSLAPQRTKSSIGVCTRVVSPCPYQRCEGLRFVDASVLLGSIHHVVNLSRGFFKSNLLLDDKRHVYSSSCLCLVRDNSVLFFPHNRYENHKGRNRAVDCKIKFGHQHLPNDLCFFLPLQKPVFLLHPAKPTSNCLHPCLKEKVFPEWNKVWGGAHSCRHTKGFLLFFV